MKRIISKEDLNSFCIAIFICANPLTWFFSFIPNILAVIITIVGVIFFLNNKRLSPQVLFVSLGIVGAFLVSIILDPGNKYIPEYLAFFIILGITGLLLPYSEFSKQTTYKIIFIISIILIPFLYTTDFGNPEYESVDYGHWMGISYGILRLINVILIILFFSRKSYKFKLLLCIPLFFYLGIYMSYASRGAIMAILLLLFLIFNIKKNLRIRTIVICLGLLMLILLFNFQQILIYTNDLLSQFNIHVLFLEKTSIMLSRHDLSNGRELLASQTIDGIIKSPFIGNGFASFEGQYGGYPHNFILQILYEGGFVFFIPFCVVLVYSIYYMLNNKKNKGNRIFLSYLFTSGVVELLFSSVYWKSQIFWLYIGYTVYIFLYELKIRKYENSLRRI